MTVAVRAARRTDVPALVRLRLANAERHVRLDPDGYRTSDAGTVRRHFEDVLARGVPSGTLISVAESSGQVIGMVEVVEPDTEAIRFYSAAGFGSSGVSLRKDLTGR
jgi:hypothetical protein